MKSKSQLVFFIYGWAIFIASSSHNIVPYVGHALASVLICALTARLIGIKTWDKASKISFVSIMYFPAQILWVSMFSVVANTSLDEWGARVLVYPLVYLCTLYSIVLFIFLSKIATSEQTLDASMNDTWKEIKSSPRKIAKDSLIYSFILFLGISTNGWGLTLAIPIFLRYLFSR